MRIQLTKPLFAWDCLEDSPTLKTVRQFLQAIPDGPLLEGFCTRRGSSINFQVAWAPGPRKERV